MVFAYDERNNTGHAYTEVYLGERESPQLGSMIKWLKEEYQLDEIPGLNYSGNETWLNLDWGSNLSRKAHPGEPYFGERQNDTLRYVVWEAHKLNSPTIVPVIDSMDSLEGWSTVDNGNGSYVNESQVFGKKRGNAIKLDYNLEKDGLVGISKEIGPNNLLGIAGLNFSYFGMDRQNTIELIMEYGDGTIFAYSWKPIVDKGIWHSCEAIYTEFECIYSAKRNESQRLEPGRIKKIKILVACNSNNGDVGGHGEIIIDDLHGIVAIPSGSIWMKVEEQKLNSKSLDLASQSKIIRGNSGESLWKSVLLALRSVKSHPNIAGYQALRDDLEMMPYPISVMKHSDTISAKSFSSDSKQLITVSSDNTIRSWDIATGDESMSEDYNMPLNKVVFTSDGSKLAIASSDTVRVFNASTFDVLAKMRHDDAIIDLTFSSDGKLLATASLDGTSRIWNASTGEDLLRLDFDNGTYKVVFSPDSKYLAIGCLDNSTRIIDPSTGSEVSRIEINKPIYRMAFSPDSTTIAGFCKYEDTVHVWNASTAKEIQTLSQKAVLTDVIFSPDGNHLVTVGLSYEIIFWNFVSGEKIKKFSHNTWVSDATFSPDGRFLASASNDDTARVWNVATGEELARMVHVNSVEAVAFSPDGDLLLTISSDNKCCIWSLSSCDKLARMIHEDGVVDVAFSPDGKYLATASTDGTARLWNATTSNEISRVKHDDEVASVAFSPDGTLIATASYDYTARIFDINANKEIAVINFSNMVLYAAFSPDGKQMISVDNSGIIKTIDIATGKQETIVQGEPKDSVRGISISPDGKKIVMSSLSSKYAHIWDIDAGREIQKVRHETGTILETNWSPDGKYLATACTDNTARIWNAQKGSVVAVLNHNDTVNDVEFSPDGKLLATASSDDTAGIWDVSSGDRLFKLDHESEVSDVVFSSDGKYLATGSKDKTARVWDVNTGEEVGRVNHGDLVIAVAFSPDGRLLATGSGDNTACVRVWRIDDLIHNANKCLRLTYASFF